MPLLIIIEKRRQKVISFYKPGVCWAKIPFAAIFVNISRARGRHILFKSTTVPVLGLKKYRGTGTLIKNVKNHVFGENECWQWHYNIFREVNFYTLTVILQRIWTGIIVKMINDNIYTTCYMLRQRIKAKCCMHKLHNYLKIANHYSI